MVRARTTAREGTALPPGTGQPKAGGAALKDAIHVAYVRAGYPSLSALALDCGVHYDTFMNWFSGKTRPRGAELQKVAAALDVPFTTLDAVYEGRAPAEQPLHEAVSELTGVLRELVVEMREERERGEDAAAALLRAAAALRPSNGADTASTERPVPGGSR